MTESWQRHRYAPHSEVGWFSGYREIKKNLISLFILTLA